LFKRLCGKRRPNAARSTETIARLSTTASESTGVGGASKQLVLSRSLRPIEIIVAFSK